MIKLRVNGQDFSGWQTVQVVRSLESVANKFSLTVSERWTNQDTSWPIREEDECRVLIGSETVITGYVDRRSLSFGPEEHSVSVEGRDRTGDLVDCSAVLDKWEFYKPSLLGLAKKLCAPYGIEVSLQPGLSLPAAPAKFSIDPGDSVHNAIERLCRLFGVLATSDGQGGLRLMRPGSTRATTELVQGQNVLAASSSFDATDRFRTYKVLGQHRGTDELNGAQAASVKGTAEDLNVRRTTRTLLVRPEGNVTAEHAKRRAEWEATTRAARGDSVSVTVQGWTQSNGTLWPLNSIVRVRCPWIHVDGDLLITQAEHSLDDGGMVTQLTLRQLNAFQPEPTVSKESNEWKELKGGV